MDTSKQSRNVIEEISPNISDFYNIVQEETESVQATMKTNLEIIRKLRMKAAEMEVETAALYHAELWHDIEDLKILTEKLPCVEK